MISNLLFVNIINGRELLTIILLKKIIWRVKSLQHAHESLLDADFDIDMITLEEIIKTTCNKLNSI